MVFTYLLLNNYAQFPALEQCLVGSLTGAVASQRVTEAFKGWLGSDGNRTDSANAEASLTVRPTSRSGTKVGVSDPLQISPDAQVSGCESGICSAQRTKVTPGITGL